MEQFIRIARTFLVTLVALLLLSALVRWIVGPGEAGVMLVLPNRQGSIPAGISDSLWAILGTFLLLIALGVALMVSSEQLALRAIGSIMLGVASAMAMMYAIEVTALPWNTYEVVWDDLVDFWGLFFGSFAALVAFGLAHALASRKRAGRTFGFTVLGVVLGSLGLMTLLWTVAWGYPPLSPEGSWMYALALSSLAFSFLAFRRVRSSRRPDERI